MHKIVLTFPTLNLIFIKKLLFWFSWLIPQGGKVFIVPMALLKGEENKLENKLIKRNLDRVDLDVPRSSQI